MPRSLNITAELCRSLREYYENGTWPKGYTKSQRQNFRRKAEAFIIENGELFHIGNDQIKRKTIPGDRPDEISKILSNEHLPDHAGVTTMWTDISKKWVGIGREQVEDFIRKCEACQHLQPLKAVGETRSIIISSTWERIQMDCVDMRRYAGINDGYGWILNILDCHTKYLFSYPMKQKSAPTVAELVQKLIFAEGPPKEIHTDNGKEFVNSDLSALCTRFHIRHIRGRPRHPQSQGQVERVNQTLTRKLAKCMHGREKRWIAVHDEIVYKYNSRRHRATNTTPMQAFRGRVGFGDNGLSTDGDKIQNKDNTSCNEDYTCSEEDQKGHLSDISDDSESQGISILTSQNETSGASTQIDPNYVQRYASKMVECRSVHFDGISFSEGDQVLLKRDFDQNPTTKKQKFDSFFEKNVYTVVEKVGDRFYRIRCNDQDRVVCKDRIHKYNKCGRPWL